MDSESAKQ